MSVVTNLILHMGILEDEEEQLAKVNAFFAKRAYPGETPLIAVDTEAHRGWYGGTKYLECHLSVGAFNHFHLDAFIAHLKSLEWVAPDDVQLILKEQHDTKFRIVDVFSFGGYSFYTSMEERITLDEADFLLDEIENHQYVLDESDRAFLRDWRVRYKQLAHKDEEDV